MTVLDHILSSKREEIRLLKADGGESRLRSLAETAALCRDFLHALRTNDCVPIIAEIKRSSPSLGKIREVQDVTVLARSYESAGAACLSVLTDSPFFSGKLEDLKSAKDATHIPILRKDFILEPVQLYESRVAGADAVLLIVAALDQFRLEELYHEALALGMLPLIEVHDEDELHSALKLDPSLVGINNRDLGTLNVDLETCARLRPLIPSGVTVVAESGIRGSEDVARLRRAGINAFLIGTTLMKSPDPGATLATLCRAGG
ncbi:MAG: indole-3-glycerol phosphate synthase TrpC [Desulfomonile tiedjei]|nr:indole-3-glycerol phosphate synthase TrpC [Desulfomonile tiedjei]